MEKLRKWFPGHEVRNTSFSSVRRFAVDGIVSSLTAMSTFATSFSYWNFQILVLAKILFSHCHILSLSQAREQYDSQQDQTKTLMENVIEVSFYYHLPKSSIKTTWMTAFVYTRVHTAVIFKRDNKHLSMCWLLFSFNSESKDWWHPCRWISQTRLPLPPKTAHG